MRATTDSPVVVSSSIPSDPVDDKCALGTEGLQRTTYEKNTAGREHADDLDAGMCGIGERTAEVEIVRKPRARRSGPSVFIAG